MSWQLAIWVGTHGKGDKPVVDVVKELALNSHHDGTSLYAPTWDELALRTRTARSTVAAALKAARDLGAISEDRPGRGRGRATVYRVNYWLCDPVNSCEVCQTLAASLSEKVQLPDLNHPATFHPTRKGPARGPIPEAKRSSSRTSTERKGPAHSEKGPAPGPTSSEGGRNHPQGGSFPHPESSDRASLRSAASGSATRSDPDQQPGDGGGAGGPGAPASNGRPPPAQQPASKGGGLPEHLRAALYEAVGGRPPPRDRVHPATWVEETRQQWEDWRTANPQPPLLPTPGGLQVDPSTPGGPEPVETLSGPEPATPAPEVEPAAAGSVDRSEVIPVENPADVEYAGGVGQVVERCVICWEDTTSNHKISRQPRHATCHDPPRKDAAA